MTESPHEPTGAFQEGADSFLQALSRASCPYPPNSENRDEWLKGWDDAEAQAGQPPSP